MPHIHPLRGFVLTSFVVAAIASPAWAQVWSVRQLQASKTDWDKLVDSPLHVEGRLASVLKNQVRLQKCELSFTMTDELARQAANAKNLELTGRIRKENGKLFFEVAVLKAMPPDLAQFQTKELAIKGNRAEDWYSLAEWARERGEFYDDAELKDATRVCLTRGIASEVRSLPPDDREGRLKLADKASEFKLPAAVSNDLRHGAFRQWWQSAIVNNPQEAAELTALEKRLGTVWPDALRPLANWPGELAEAYFQDPLVTFSAADPLQQRQLQRVFGVQVQIRRITVDAADDGRNGNDIATQLARVVPEQPQLAESYRDKHLGYQLSQIKTASRQAALSLAEQFRQRDRAELALETLRKWLAAKEQEPPVQRDATALIALSDDYRQWLKDDKQALSLLTAAYRLEPQSEDVAIRMKDLGYEQRGGRWERMIPTTTDPLPAKLPGIDAPIAIGMTATELKERIGQPQSRTVIATAGKVDEWWTFGVGEGSRLMIQLQHRRSDREPRVVRFENR